MHRTKGKKQRLQFSLQHMFPLKFILHQYLNWQFALLSTHKWNLFLQAAIQREGEKKDNTSSEEISDDVKQT